MNANYTSAGLGELFIAPRDIVFIMDNVADIDVLAKRFGADKEVVILDASRDGLDQIAAALAGRSNIEALHLVSHGAAGRIDLGATTLDTSNLDAHSAQLQAIGRSMAEGGDRIDLGATTLDTSNLDAHSAQLQAIGRSMAEGGDILLYGCEVGAGGALLDRLAIATGADIAASNDATGSAALGANWDLEVSRGDVDAAAIVDPALAALYSSTLAIASSTVNFGGDGNFDSFGGNSGPANDVIYRVNGQNGYELVIDGKDSNIASYEYSDYMVSNSIGGANESEITFSFANGQVFTPTSIKVTNYQYQQGAQQLVFRGYDAGGNLVGTPQTVSTLGNNVSYVTASFSGLTNIATLKLTADPASNGGKLIYLAFDDFSMVNIQPGGTTVSSVTSTNLDGAYRAGAEIVVSVTFSAAVDVAGGAPTLQLETGDTDRFAVYQSGSGTDTLLFKYVVQPGDTSADLDYLGTGALALNGATIKSTAGALDATLTLPAPGNAVSLGGSKALVIDTAAPTAPATPILAPASDTGSSNSDGVTNDRTPTFTGAPGSVEAGAQVGLYDTDGVTLIGTTTAAGDGSWSATVGADLAAGAHTVTAKAFDAAGNGSAASAGVAITIDVTAPVTQVVNVAFSSDTGVAGDFVTSIDLQTISGGLSAPLAGDERVEISLDNGVSFLAASAGAGATTWSIPAELVGTNVLQVRVADVAGNTGPVYSQSYTIDAVAPDAPSTPDLVAASDTGTSNTDDVTGDTTPEFSGTAEANATVTLYADGNAVGNVAAGGDGKWVITSTALTGGTYNFTAKALDLAGGESLASGALAVTVVTDAPTTTNTTFTLDNDSNIVGDLVTNVSGQVFSGKLSSALAAGEQVQVYVNGGWATATASTGSDTWTLETLLGDGTQTVEVQVINAIGNAGPAGRYDVTLDKAPPTVAVSADRAVVKVGETAAVTFTFSDDPGASFDWDGKLGDIDVSGGELSALQGSGTVRTATFTPLAATQGSAVISVKAGSFNDLAGNLNAESSLPALAVDTVAPDAPSTPLLAAASDTGASNSDGITSNAQPTFTGTAESGSTVYLYDGGKQVGSGTAIDGAWSIAPTVALGEGKHTLTAATLDAAGNLSAASGGQDITIDTTAPGVTIGSGAALLKIGESATITFTFSEALAEPLGAGSIVVDGGKLGELKSNGLKYTAAFTPNPGIDGGKATITLAPGTYRDLAGNLGTAGVTPTLSFDTLAPLAPPAPTLAAASDSGAAGDGITTNATQIIEGSGAGASALMRLYDGETLVGSGRADVNGVWSITTILGVGSHSLRVTQDDAAGNTSTISAAFALTVNAAPTPNPDPAPPIVVDGVPVATAPVTLPGGVAGTSIAVPIITAGRTETNGAAALADIPLLASGGQTLLLGQLPVGYGLSSSGAVVASLSGLELLLSSIRAATPSHAPGDQGHLVQNGVQFLNRLDTSQLLVSTVRPVSTAGAEGALILSGIDPAGTQGTALVIDTGGLAAGSALELRNIDFAAIVGAATVSAHGSETILTGDSAVQRLTVDAGSNSQVFAGGGNDVLGFAAAAIASTSASSAEGGASALAVPVTGVTTLHGGLAGDTASFAGLAADYDVAFYNGYAVINSKAAPDAKALVVNVEELQFGDGVVAVENGAGLTTLAGMYQTAFARQADLGGFEFWADLRDDGVSWGTIALELIGSSEGVQVGGGFTGNAANDIGLLYQGLFDRAADAAGLAYWQDALARGMTLEQVASSFVESAEMVGHQRAVLDWDFIV